jgi:succinate dehydrogenase flavin-adding protein (antitoxin of CptAB toxin-antitoxin module)
MEKQGAAWTCEETGMLELDHIDGFAETHFARQGTDRSDVAAAR